MSNSHADFLGIKQDSVMKINKKKQCDIQELCQYSVDNIFSTLTLFPELIVEKNCLSQQHVQYNLMIAGLIRQLQRMLLHFS